MKTIGLLGGVSWHSSAIYYDRINRGVAERLGRHRSARILLASIDYGDVRDALDGGDWKRVGELLVRTCRGLQRGGADGIYLCSNTIHHFAPRIQSQISIPVLHIADALADSILAEGFQRVALFGTAFTMTRPFYRQRLEARGVQVVTPHQHHLAELDRIILEELTAGVIHPASRDFYVDVMEQLQAEGADAMVLGCTEIGLLVRPEDVRVPVLDTTEIHARHAIDWALG